MMSFGVPIGTTTAAQVAPSTSGKPASAMVGVSGSACARVFDATASARSLPSLTIGTAGAIAPNEAGDRRANRGSAAVEGHVNEVGRIRQPEQFADQRRRRADA